MVKTSKVQTIILTDHSQLNNLDNIGAVLIYPSKASTSDLIKLASQNELSINAIVDEDPDNQFVAKNLASLGYPSGCFLVVKYNEKRDSKSIINSFSNALQLGYQAAIIINQDDYSTDDLKMFKQALILVIDEKNIKNNLMIVPELLKNRSIGLLRDYTNVNYDISDGAYVGINRDTSGLQGGPSIGYSTNGKNFYAAITPKGFIFRQIDAERMWRLLKPQQRDDIDQMVGDTVAKEVAAQDDVLNNARNFASDAVKKADSAIKQSTTNSNAIAAIDSAVSTVRSDASAATQSAANALSDAQSANDTTFAEINSAVAKNRDDISQANKSLDGVASDLKSYAQDAVSQGKTIAEMKSSQGTIQADVASAKGDVAQLKVTASNVTAQASDNAKNIASLQVSASSASVALKNATSDIAVVNATASSVNADLQNAKSDIASVKVTANALETDVSNAKSDINQVKIDATGMREQIADGSKQIATINTSVNGLQTHVSNVDSTVSGLTKTVSANSTAIEQNQKSLALKANQTDVDQLNNSVKSQSASLTVLNNEIATKVTSSDVDKAIDGRGFVNQSFVESSIKQSSDKLTETIANLSGNVQNVTADLNGLQSTVKSKADQSQITQLNNLIQSKVNSSDYESKISQLSSDINARVTKGDLISQINLEAGQALIQSKKIFLDADSVVFGKNTKAFIPDAAITNINADKVNAGTLTGVNLRIDNDNDLTLIDNQGVTNAGLVPNTNNRFITTQINDGVIRFGNTALTQAGTSDNLLSDAENLTDGWQVNVTVDKTNLYDGKYAVGQLDKQGNSISQEIKDKLAKQKGTVYKLSFFAKADNDNDKLLASFNNVQESQELTTAYQQYTFNLSNKDDIDEAKLTFTGDKSNAGNVYITEPMLTRNLTNTELAEKAISGIGKTYDSSIFGNDGNLLESSKGTITIHAGDLLNDKSFWTSDGTWISKSIPPAEIKLNPNKNGSGAVTIQASGSVIDMNASSVSIFSALGDPAKGQGVQIEGLGIGGNTIWSEDDFFSVGSQRTGTYTYINAKGVHNPSTLSSKTRIKRLDRKEALSTIMRDDIYTYLYKSDVQLGLTKRHASLVIDDENDVAQYRAPEEFISESGNARDDGTQLGYLIAAVQYQQEQIEELKKKLEEK